MPTPRISIPNQRIAEFCRKWRITELSLFGSVLRDDFGPDSDVDVLVVFEPDAQWSYWEWPDMQDELSIMLEGRRIHLVERRSVVNPFIRHEVLNHRQVLYAA